MSAVAGAKFGFSHRCKTPLKTLNFLPLYKSHPSQHPNKPQRLTDDDT
jgi:hypothetical protein